MAKIKFGAMVNDARGSLDGVVYSKNQYGGYVRVKVSPVQPRSEKQIEARSILAEISTYYSNTLTDAQRLAWKQFASNNPVIDVFGNSQTLTALAMFQTVNAVLKHSGVAIIADPPANMDVTALTSATVTAAETGQSVGIAFGATPLPAGHKLYIWATAPLPGGVSFFQNKLRFLGVSAAAQTSPFAAGTMYTGRFGGLVQGQKIGVLIASVNTNTGAVSLGIQSLITVGA